MSLRDMNALLLIPRHIGLTVGKGECKTKWIDSGITKFQS